MEVVIPAPTVRNNIFFADLKRLVLKREYNTNKGDEVCNMFLTFSN